MSRNVALFIASALMCASHVMANKDSVNFLVMGDWGGSPHFPYRTRQEKATAGGMGAAVPKTNATFALALGDNFYDTGVTDVHSHRFKNTFESVFTAGSLQSPFEFRVIAGNHDHNGNVSAQIAYSAVSRRWHFPSPYYTFRETAQDGSTVQVVMIDTVVLSGNSEEGKGLRGYTGELNGNELKGPADVHAANTQLQWIESTLKSSSSDADYILVAGHYPMYSICEHGPTSNLIHQLKPLFLKYRVSAYLNGHDHCAEYIDMNDGVQYHTIGSAHENNPSTAHKSTVKASQLKFHTGAGDGGFASIRADKKGMYIVHYDGDGKTLFTAPTMKSRRQGY